MTDSNAIEKVRENIERYREALESAAVHDAAKWLARRDRARDAIIADFTALLAETDRLRALVAEAGEPAWWIVDWPHGDDGQPLQEVYRTKRDADAFAAHLLDEYKHVATVTPLYTAPAKDGDGRDGEMYRQIASYRGCVLHITRNENHAVNYMSLSDYVENWPEDYRDVPKEELEKMIATNTDWCVHFFPTTPGGSYACHGATLDAAMEVALSTGHFNAIAREREGA